MFTGVMNLINLTINQLKRATAIKERIEALNKELQGILGASAKSGASPNDVVLDYDLSFIPVRVQGIQHHPFAVRWTCNLVHPREVACQVSMRAR